MDLSERIGFKGNDWGITSVLKVNEKNVFNLVILGSATFPWGYLYDL